MKKIIVLSLALAAFLGAKEIDTAKIFLSDVKSMHALKSFLKKNKNDIVKLKLRYGGRQQNNLRRKKLRLWRRI